MFNVNVDDTYIYNDSGTSEGTQIKYFFDGYWYKKDSRGREGLTEYLCSKLLTFSNLDSTEYVLYEKGLINGFPGCRSKNFLTENVQLLTIYRLYYNEFGENISTVIAQMDEMQDRIEYVIKFVRDFCQMDITDYLRKIFTLDYIILNEDRHLNNIAVLYDHNEGSFKPAPIFDQGVSLLTCNQSINKNFSIEENVKRVTARPFSGSHKRMYDYFGKGFEIDGISALNWLKTEEDSYEKEVLEHQILVLNI